MIDGVDHAGSLVEQDNLVNVLDLARIEHDLLAVAHLDTGLQRQHHRRLADIDAEQHAVAPRVDQHLLDLLSGTVHQTGRRRLVPRRPSMPAWR